VVTPSRLRVLVVDDLDTNTMLIADVLAEHGFDVVESRDGTDALRLLGRETFHLVVADALMPIMDGFKLCREIRANPASAALPYVIYTGNFVGDADRAFARSIGADRYVMKQGGVGPLVEAVTELAAERYGVRPVPPPEVRRIDDRAFLEGHNEVLVRKLQEQMAELEHQAAALRTKNAELALSEARYRSLFDGASIGILVVDREQVRVLDVNARGAALLGLPREEILARDGVPFLEARVQEQMRLAQTFISGETSLVGQAHGQVVVEIGFGPMIEPDDARVLVFMRDITEEKRLRDQLIQFEKMSLMGRLAAGIAHEIRNPLSSVTLNVQYLVQRLGEETDLLECAQDALESAQRVDTVIENTLSLARMGPVAMTGVELGELVRRSLAFFKVPLRSRRLTLETDLDPRPLRCQGDPKLLQQVILNIVQNAIDASPEGGKVQVSTMRESAPGTPAVALGVVAVRDFGPGISAEQRRHLFEQFYTTKAGGTGLGLALSKQIMERHNGSIDIHSAPREGALVRMLIPIAMNDEGYLDG
jgi:PAS domain S-box-containing protein